MTGLSHIPLEAVSLYRMALEHLNKGNQETALKHLSQAVVIAPTFSTALCEMGRCYEKLGRYTDALSKFDKVLQINQSHIEAEISRQRILDKMGKVK